MPDSPRQLGTLCRSILPAPQSVKSLLAAICLLAALAVLSSHFYRQYAHNESFQPTSFDWRAEWIASPYSSSPTACFRKTFDLTGNTRSAYLVMTADTYYRLSVNGREPNPDFRAEAWSSLPKSQTPYSQLGYPRNLFLALQLVAYLFYGAGIIMGATHADRTSPATTIRNGAIGLVFIGLLFGPGLSFGGIALAGVTLSISMLVLGYGNAALGAWLSQLFPVRLRYSGISLTFNMGAIIGGAITPLVAQQLSSHGHPGLTGLLLSLGAAITVVGTRLGRTEHD